MGERKKKIKLTWKGSLRWVAIKKKKKKRTKNAYQKKKGGIKWGVGRRTLKRKKGQHVTNQKTIKGLGGADLCLGNRHCLGKPIEMKNTGTRNKKRGNLP